MKIRVPATTANLGPGFDSFGLALDLYLELEIKEPSEKWRIAHKMTGLPNDEKNLIIKTALTVCPEILPHQLIMTTDIPTARGLGSSSSAIVAGIELANQLGELNLSKEDKVKWASKIEGHPDNVAPAVLGGFVVAAQIENEVYYNRHDFPECEVIAVVPNYELLTSDSRGVLPETVPYKYGVQASTISNMVISYLIDGKIEEAANLMAQDLWHEPFRKKLVPELDKIRGLQSELGFYTALLSGAGPTILVLTSKETKEVVLTRLIKDLPDCTVLNLKVNSVGVEIISHSNG